jgi:hypothetical protein
MTKATIANSLGRFPQMTRCEKAVATLGATAALLIVGIAGAYWRANTVPSRPRGVSSTAVFLWAPFVGFPGPRRGWWLACSERSGQVHCMLSGVDGKTEYEGQFAPYNHDATISNDQLRIDAIKTREHKVWIGEALVPLVYLENGQVLIPASKYEEGTRLLNQLKSNH